MIGVNPDSVVELEGRDANQAQVMNQVPDSALLVGPITDQITRPASNASYRGDATQAPPPENLNSAAHRNGFDFGPLDVFGNCGELTTKGRLIC